VYFFLNGFYSDAFIVMRLSQLPFLRRGFLLLSIFVLSVSGCSSVDVRKPAPLLDFKPQVEVKPAWSISVGKSEVPVFGPVVVGSALIAASAQGQVTKIDGKNGQVLWQTQIDGDISAGPASDGNTTVVVNTKGKVFALDENGKSRWQKTVSAEVLSPALVTDKLVIVRTLDGRIYAFDVHTGEQRWLYQRVASSLVLRTALGMNVWENNLVAGFPGGKLALIGLDNGAMVWEVALALSKGVSEIERLVDVAGMPAVSGRYVCSAAFQGRLGCFELATGVVQWSTDFSGVTGSVMDNAGVYASDGKSVVSGFNTQNGKLLWRNDKLLWRNVGVPLLKNDVLVMGDGEGYVHFLSTKDGEMLARAVSDGSAVSAAPVMVGNTLVVQTRNGRLYGYTWL